MFITIYFITLCYILLSIFFKKKIRFYTIMREEQGTWPRVRQILGIFEHPRPIC